MLLRAYGYDRSEKTETLPTFRHGALLPRGRIGDTLKSMKITKAIIPVAGWGTRRLPITKTIEKCMLPIGNRPLVDYIVEDCIKAGIADIYFVVSAGSTQLQSYYGDNTQLVDYLHANGKADSIPLVTPPRDVTFHYVEQDASSKYGTAIPVALVAPLLEADESVVVLMGDDFMYSTDETNDIARLIEAAEQGTSAMLGVRIPQENVSRYGVLEYDMNNNFVQIVEKPTPVNAPSNLINVSKYVLNPSAVQQIVGYAETERTSEYYITDPINTYVAQGGIVKIVQAAGEYLDGGSVEGWLHANNVVVGGNTTS